MRDGATRTEIKEQRDFLGVGVPFPTDQQYSILTPPI